MENPTFEGISRHTTRYLPMHLSCWSLSRATTRVDPALVAAAHSSSSTFPSKDHHLQFVDAWTGFPRRTRLSRNGYYSRKYQDLQRIYGILEGRFIDEAHLLRSQTGNYQISCEVRNFDRTVASPWPALPLCPSLVRRTSTPGARPEGGEFRLSHQSAWTLTARLLDPRAREHLTHYSTSSSTVMIMEYLNYRRA